MMSRVPDELLPILTKFHRDVLLPDMQRILDAAEGRVNARFDALKAHVEDLERRLSELDAS